MFRRPAFLIAPAAVALAGCTAAPAKVPPTTLTLTDYAIAAPATLPAAMATFNVVNHGKEGHQAALVRLDSGKTYGDFENALKNDAKGPPPAWIIWMGGAHAMPGDSSGVTIPLEAGNYVWFCLIPSSDGVPHVMKGMSAPMTVTASTAAADAAPAADVNVVMSDYTWDLSTPLTVGRRTLKITNAAGSQAHEMVLVRLQSGKKTQDFLDWGSKMAGPPPIEMLKGIPPLQPGQVNYITLDVAAGSYALICFVPDAKDGQPHAMHGMVKEFSVQ